MNAEEYLQALIAKNPAIGRPDDQTVTLTARGLRALIRQAHEKGYEHCTIISKKLDKLFGKRSM